eukprot:5198737-Pleurochrysis_carterae.AAC.3
MRKKAVAQQPIDHDHFEGQLGQRVPLFIRGRRDDHRDVRRRAQAPLRVSELDSAVAEGA